MINSTWDCSALASAARSMTSLWTYSYDRQGSSIHEPIFTCKGYQIAKLPFLTAISEDFGLANARRILDKYRPNIACFNDDVQGTGCVTLAAIMAGLHVSKFKLADLRMVIFGSGTAGTGIADQVRDAMATESGKSKEEVSKQIWYVCALIL